MQNESTNPSEPLTLAPALDEWETRLAELTAFQHTYGHSDPPEDSPLAAWLNDQRQALSRVTRLQALGILARPQSPTASSADNELRWSQRFEEMAAFKTRFGHTRVMDNWPENPALSRWRSKQRENYRAGTLSAERIARLDSIDFEWVTAIDNDQVWSQRFEELAAFKARFGHTRVTKEWPENPALGRWCGKQREHYRADTLAAERIARLYSIDFEWVTAIDTDQVWSQHFDELVAFTARFGHARVTKDWPENPALGRWCSKQREHYRAGTLAAERIARLGSIDFVLASPTHRVSTTPPSANSDYQWTAVKRPSQTPEEVIWEDRLADLIAYEAEMGDYEVPAHNGPHQQLGLWIEEQRMLHSSHQLASSRQKRLSVLGVPWAHHRSKDPTP